MVVSIPAAADRISVYSSMQAQTENCAHNNEVLSKKEGSADLQPKPEKRGPSLGTVNCEPENWELRTEN